MQGRGLPTGPPALRHFWGPRRRSVRLAARTLVFQAGNGGSIPPRTITRGQRTEVRKTELRPVAQWRSGPLTTDRLGVRFPPGRLNGVQVLAAACPALNREGEGSNPSGPTRYLTIRLCSMCAHDVAAACCLAMAEVRVRLPLGALSACGRNGNSACFGSTKMLVRTQPR